MSQRQWGEDISLPKAPLQLFEGNQSHVGLHSQKGNLFS